MRIIQTIHSPQDIKKMSLDELRELAVEIRYALLSKLSIYGGHVASNLGIVEASIAMHYVFDSPNDKLVFDTSHQTYTHKILTGRAKAFLDEAHYGDVTGYSAPGESPHDHFIIGHASTAISLAMGLCKGRDVTGGKENIVAIIGDGSLSGGLAMEGLNCAGEYDGNLIIVVNDNQQSIQENHGGIYKNLALLRASNGNAQNNWFEAQGLDYIYEENGNDVEALIRVFQRVKDTRKPVVVHIHSVKGKGYSPAELNPEEWHYTSPFNLGTGSKYISRRKSYSEITAEFFVNEAKKRPELVVLAAGTCGVIGLTPSLREILGSQYIDSGIAEEHTIDLACGIAANGGIPVFGTLGTFFQRTYDQLMHDVALNHSSVILLLFGCGSYGLSDITHTCLSDIAMLSSIPGIDYLAPTCVEEYMDMLNWFVEHIRKYGGPIAIRIPGVNVTHREVKWSVDYMRRNTFVVDREGKDIAIIAVGNMYDRAEIVAEELINKGISPTLINPRFVSGLDKNILSSLYPNHKLVVTIEDGIIEGGFGERVAGFYSHTAMRVLIKGFDKIVCAYEDVDSMLTQSRMQVDQLVEDIMNVWNSLCK